MFNWRECSTVLLSMLLLAGCGGSHNNDAAQATPQGTLDLQEVKVGMPESVFEKASMTFVPDPKGSFAGKNQYLSRNMDANGAQYVVQCKNGRCYEVQVYFHEAAVPKDLAVKTLSSLLPVESRSVTATNDTEVKAGKAANPIEVLQFGKEYKGEIAYADKSAKGVILVNAWCLPASAAQ
jgi:hypothetical protein